MLTNTRTTTTGRSSASGRGRTRRVKRLLPSLIATALLATALTAGTAQASWMSGGFVESTGKCSGGLLGLRLPIIRSTTGANQKVAFRHNLYKWDGTRWAYNSSADWLYGITNGITFVQQHDANYRFWDFWNARTGERYNEYTDTQWGFVLAPGYYMDGLQVTWYSASGAVVKQTNDWLTVEDRAGAYCSRS
jgi:hypothetical protein